MKKTNFITMITALIFLLITCLPAAFCAQKTISTSIIKKHTNSSPTPKKKTVICNFPPATQVVNNSGIKLHQVKIGSIIFSRNLSRCSNGCSTGFKNIHPGKNRVYIKTSPHASWNQIGSVGNFKKCKKYAVNIIKKGKLLFCAELFQRSDTDLKFNQDKKRKKLSNACNRIHPVSGFKKTISKKRKITFVPPIGNKQKSKSAKFYRIKGYKAKPAFLPVKKILRPSLDRKRVVSDLVPKDTTVLFRFISPNSHTNVSRPELQISYYLRPDIDSGYINFFLLHNGRTIMEVRKYIHELERGQRLQTFYWFLNALSYENNGTGYRISALISGNPPVLSEPFNISLPDSRERIICAIVEQEPQLYQDKILHIQAYSTHRKQLVNCQLFFIPLPGLRRRGIPVPIDNNPDTTSFEAPLTELEPGRYRLRFVADIMSGDYTHRIIAHATAESRHFSVLARPDVSSAPTPVLESYLPEAGYRLPLDIDVPVSWRVVYGWQHGDRVVFNLRHGTTELYNTARWEQTGLIKMPYTQRINSDAAGDYQVVIEHRRGSHGEQIINSVTKNFTWFYNSRTHCSSDHPMQIVNVFSPHSTFFQPGGRMHVDFCIIVSTTTHPHIEGARVTLHRESTGEEWVVGEWRPTAPIVTPQSFDWHIPEDIEVGTDYYLHISEIGGSIHSRFSHNITINRP